MAGTTGVFGEFGNLDRGRRMQSGHQILELVAKAKGPAGLIEAGPPPQPAA